MLLTIDQLLSAVPEEIHDKAWVQMAIAHLSAATAAQEELIAEMNRQTSDRNAVIEECAKVCDGRAIKKGRDDECVNEAELCAALIRALATPTQTQTGERTHDE